MTTDLQSPSFSHRRERGSVVVIALILLALLTIIGISASRTTEIEIMIAGNERIAKQNLYLAEGAAMRAVQVMDETELTVPPDLGLLHSVADSPGIKDAIYEDDTWDNYSVSLNVYNDFNAQIDARALALSKGPSLLTSCSMGEPCPWDFESYGRSWWRGGEGLVAVGYRGLVEN
ncbi:MAG: PilX N-terminal domain-containing pilus assembly protein [Thermodesulfobacteriota bacterium]